MIYEYECSVCGHAMETDQSIKDEPLVDCPACGADGLRRLCTGGAATLFLGYGWTPRGNRIGGDNVNRRGNE